MESTHTDDPRQRQTSMGPLALTYQLKVLLILNFSINLIITTGLRYMELFKITYNQLDI